MKESTEAFDPAAESVRHARRFVARTLESWGSDAGDDACLLVSELATNAVIHAGTPYTVTVAMSLDVVRVCVADASTATARRGRYGEMAATGRGLGMVADLSSKWGIDTSPAGKVIWFEIAARKPDADRATTVRDLAAGVDADLDVLLAELGGWDDPSDHSDAPRGLRSTGARA